MHSMCARNRGRELRGVPHFGLHGSLCITGLLTSVNLVVWRNEIVSFFPSHFLLLNPVKLPLTLARVEPIT